jgi:hypothetical protein
MWNSRRSAIFSQVLSTCRAQKRFYTTSAVCCLSPRQLFADSCLFSTEGMIDNVRIQEVYHSYAAINYLQTDKVPTFKNPEFDSTERYN